MQRYLEKVIAPLVRIKKKSRVFSEHGRMFTQNAALDIALLKWAYQIADPLWYYGETRKPGSKFNFESY